MKLDGIIMGAIIIVAGVALYFLSVAGSIGGHPLGYIGVAVIGAFLLVGNGILHIPSTAITVLSITFSIALVLWVARHHV